MNNKKPLSMNQESYNTFENLKNEFNSDVELKPIFKSTNPLGIEVEVKWRYYFPQLWDKYLSHCSYKDLPKEQQEALTEECNLLEKQLVPRLEKTVHCGIPKGLDKYYEFALNPSCNIELITGQLEILQEQNLIPQGHHSLHITVGNMRVNKDAYYLLMLLELLTLDSDRILEGFHQQNPQLSSAWGRKGLGGLFQKEKDELKYGSQSAVEFRTLQLTPTTNIYELLSLTSHIADIIIHKQLQNNNSELSDSLSKWNNFVYKSQEALTKYSLADTNWKKPNLSPEYWQCYIQHFNDLKEEIPQIFQEYFPDIMKNISIEKSIAKRKI